MVRARKKRLLRTVPNQGFGVTQDAFRVFDEGGKSDQLEANTVIANQAQIAAFYERRYRPGERLQIVEASGNDQRAWKRPYKCTTEYRISLLQLGSVARNRPLKMPLCCLEIDE